MANNMVPMPKMSMAVRQGPWPKCVGMSGEDCEDYIKDNAEDVHTEIVPQNSPVTEDFRVDRVRIFVDDEGVVVAAPKKG